MVLCCETSVGKIARHTLPLMQATIIEHLQFVSYYKRYNRMIQTFLEHYQSPYTTITILKGMDGFKTMVKVKDILKCHYRLALILL